MVSPIMGTGEQILGAHTGQVNAQRAIFPLKVTKANWKLNCPTFQQKTAPPSTLIACPVIALAFSEHKNNAASAISFAVCPRPCRIPSRNPANCWSLSTFSLRASSAPNSLLILVSVTGPGQSAFIRTPLRAASAALYRVNPSSPALAAAYADPQLYAVFAEMLEIFKITPRFRSYIPGNASWLNRNAARKCTATTRSNSSIGYSSTGSTGP